MIKKQVFIFIAILFSTFYGFGQVTTIDFEIAGNGYTASATEGPGTLPHIDVFNRTNPNIGGNSTYMWSVEDLSLTNPSIDLDQIDITGSLDFTFAIDMIAHHFQDWDAIDELLITYSIDGGSYQNLMWIQSIPDGDSFNSIAALDTDFDNDGECTSKLPSLTTGTNAGCTVSINTFETFTTSAISLSSNTTLDIKLQFNGLLSGDEGIYLDNIVITETSSCTDTVDFNNVQSPATGTITVGGVFNVYEQVLELGITDALGQGANIEAWIGYSSANTDPSGSGWTWITANYNTDVGNNDEYILDLGAQIASSGTYYYASRFRLNSCGFTYGGFDSGGGDGTWDGTNDVNGVLTVNPHILDWCNLQSPPTGNITTGTVFDVYAQTYEPGVTDTPSSQGANIEAWIGYSSADTNPNGAGWTWVVADYNPLCGANCGTPENNDEYFKDIGSSLPAGTYYYASRFRIDNDVYNYGGYNVSGGGFWNGTTNINGVLIITDPPLANVVITEIMYNTPGEDDEWIEICNVSGSTQDISNYIIDVGGLTEFTFPASTTIADGICITVSLGSNGDGTYNNDCPFTPDFGIPAGTDYNGRLVNSTNTIMLFASDGTTTIDIVTYDDGDDFTTDGGGSSYQIIDTSADNSTTGSNWQAVNNGGSPGTNSLISPCTTLDPDINVEGNLGTFPDIAGDGSNVPAGFNNTLFAARAIGDSQLKSFRVQNLGAADLNITSVVITGDGFSANTIATPIASSGVTTFNITFAPLTTGTLTATVEIYSDDPNESPYTFNIKGEGICASSTISVTSFAPTSGPVGTEVTITGSGFSGTSTVTINGVSANVISSSATELVIEIPSINYSGSFTVTQGICYTISTPDFILVNDNGSCGLTDLIMSEIYDRNGGSLGYIEIYNGTGATIDLTNYYIRRYGDAGDLTDDIYTDYYFTPSISTINDGQVLYGKISTSADTATPDFDYANVGGFAGINSFDIFHLYNGTTIIDVYVIPGAIGYTALRDVNTAGPNTTSNPSDWTHLSTENTSDLGIFNYVSSIGTPTVNTPNDVTGCNTSAEFDATGTAGGGGSLTYQWYYNEGTSSSSNWNLVTSGAFPLATVSGITGPILTLSGAFYSYSGYQFYCFVIEDGACGIASDAAQIKTDSTTWNGSWDNGTSDLNTIAIINENYDTTINGNLEACQLIINASKELNVRNNTYVKVQNNVINDGTIEVQSHGAFVQLGDGVAAGTFTNNGTSSVIKETANLNNWYEYTYWSSPVKNQTVENAFPNTSSNRRFWFNAQNFLDQTREVGNNNNTLTGQDDIDDNGDDWQIASGIMAEGLGYAATSSTSGLFPGTDQATFIGEFYTGDIDVNVYKNDLESQDNNWNLIGNPYASAISADLFLTENTSVLDEGVPIDPPIGGVTEGAIFIWSQNSPPSNSNNGNENSNFAQSDYAIINLVTEVAGGDGVTPNRFIPSGQAFFIAYDHAAIGTPITGGSTIKQSIVKFRNSMRMADGTSNSQFFRTSNPNDNKLWLNLTTDSGAFSQVAMAYVENATNEYDSFSYDTPRNLSSDTYTSIYTTIEEEEMKFAIQSKIQNSLTLNEIIPLGFDTTIASATLYTISIARLEGVFLTNNSIYLKDNLMNVIHDLSASDYIFTSEIGEYKDRFEILFNNTLSLNEDVFNTNDLNIIELNNGHVKFTVSDNKRIKSVTIIDVLGRVLYQLKGNNNSETYNLSNLSQSTYIAKVELFNGYVITKKAIKRK